MESLSEKLMRPLRKPETIFAYLIILAVLGLAACSGSTGTAFNPLPSPLPSAQASASPSPSPTPSTSPSPPLPTAPPAPTPTPRVLALGQLIGAQTFPSGDTAQGGNGAPIDGISCGSPNLTFHIHSHLSLWHNGVQIADAVAIGIPGAVITTLNGGPYTNKGTCFYNLHTHDSSGIIHIEGPSATNFTLGQVFDIWGEPLSIGNVAGFMGPTLVYVDTNSSTPSATVYTGDPRAIVLTNHQQITIEVGGPFVYPLFYNWPY